MFHAATNIADLAAQILADPAALEALVAPLGDAAAAELVEHFKAEADRHWFINANRSLEFAELIVRIAGRRDNPRAIALGTMARGDALKLLGRLQEAWDELESAGRMFADVGDAVGWARTRIGKVFICVDVNRVQEALADATRAQAIFQEHRLHEKRLVLDINTASTYNLLGEQSKALSIYTGALSTALALGEEGERWLGSLHTNVGNVYALLGDFERAIEHHDHAYAIFVRRQEISEAALSQHNLGSILISQGKYSQGLGLLYKAHNFYLDESLESNAYHVARDIIECYLLLNRLGDAHDLATSTIDHFRSINASYSEGLTLLQLAIAEAKSNNLDASHLALSRAEQAFLSIGAKPCLAMVHLRRGQVALKQGDPVKAQHEAITAQNAFASDGQQVNSAAALLLYAQTLLEGRKPAAAYTAASRVLGLAKRCNSPMLRYGAHVLLGEIAEKQGEYTRAQRRYTAAIATVERVQSGLTITLRPDFLEDKGEALRALIGLYQRSGQVARAFETLERAKSHALLNYLANRESLRWPSDEPRVQALIAELNRLREEHRWFYSLSHEHQRLPNEASPPITPDRARAELATREKRMRAISEQLHLFSGNTNQARPRGLRSVQAVLSSDELLIEFYNDGSTLWAFTLDQNNVQMRRMPASLSEIDQLIEHLQRNIAFALDSGQEAPALRGLTAVAQRILQRLYTALLAPIEEQLIRPRRLIVVPYGVLHYLPFHLLRRGGEYLIERREVVVLPVAGLLTHPGPRGRAGARVLAHSWEGRLPQTHREAQVVLELFDSRAYVEDQARRVALGGIPEQILHIAAHGQHRLDQPDLSFIQLADGQLYTDDLLQHDMGYELVVLSACETGRANVAAGDELIGLGRGFLYAGAGALISSLWRVADATTVELMAHLYRHLRAGASKAAALRAAQLAQLAGRPGMHPAFWGAFQLVGDPRPLSACASDTQADAELQHLAVYA